MEEDNILVIGYGDKLTDQNLKQVKKASVVLIRRNGNKTKEFNSESYYKRAEDTIALLRKKGFDKDIILECKNYDEVRNVGITDEKTKYVYDVGPINLSQKPATKEEVDKINAILDSMVSNIKQSNVGELEKFIACYKIVTSFKPYLKKHGVANTNEETYTNEILFNDYMLCGGYSYLLMELLKRVDINSAYYSSEDKNSDERRHARLLVALKSGYYVCDPTRGVKVRYYGVGDYYKTHTLFFDSLMKLHGSKFNIKNVKKYAQELLDDSKTKDKKLYNKYKKIFEDDFLAKATAEEKLMKVIYSTDQILEIGLKRLFEKDNHYLCSKDVEDEFKSIINLNSNLQLDKEYDLISRKYKELPIIQSKDDIFLGALNTIEKARISDGDKYESLEGELLDFYDKDCFYDNLSSLLKVYDMRYVFRKLCDLLSILYPKEFQLLYNEYQNALSNFKDPELNFDLIRFLSDVYDLLESKHNQEIELETIVAAAANVEEKILGLNKVQAKKYYDDTLLANQKIKKVV